MLEFPENVQEVVEVFDSNIFYAKVIYDEAELDRTPFVAPETRGGFNFIIAFNESGIGGDSWLECRPGEGHSKRGKF